MTVYIYTVSGQFVEETIFAVGVSFNQDGVSLPTGIGGVNPPPANGYVTEDGVTNYVAEDGTTFYVQES